MINYHDLKDIYSSPEFTFTWDIGNKIVVRKNGYEKGDPITYHFYIRDLETDSCKLLFAEDAKHDGEFYALLNRAEKNWTPPKKLETVKIFEVEHLQQIESVLLGLVKRGKTNEITPYDFMVCYYGERGWVCYNPTIDKLINYHKKTSNEVSSEYLEFLQSNTVKNICLEIVNMRSSGNIKLPFALVTV
jgi:hypothetical protein